jgi:hypothetical protein
MDEQPADARLMVTFRLDDEGEIVGMDTAATVLISHLDLIEILMKGTLRVIDEAADGLQTRQ